MVGLSYAAGAILTLLFKLFRYVYEDKDHDAKEAILEWFFEKSSSNGASWVATIGVVWVGGYMYVAQAPVLLEAIGVTDLPVHASVAFLLGYVMEMIAPNIAKKITEKVLLKVEEWGS